MSVLETTKNRMKYMVLKNDGKGWRGGKTVKSSGLSTRRPGFNSEHPHGSSPLSVTPAPGLQCHLMVFRSIIHACGTHDYMISNTHTHKIKTNASEK